jgi:hypothetical protein
LVCNMPPQFYSKLLDIIPVPTENDLWTQDFSLYFMWEQDDAYQIGEAYYTPIQSLNIFLKYPYWPSTCMPGILPSWSPYDTI